MAFALDYIIIAGYLLFVVAIGVVLNTLFPAVAHELFSNPLSGQIAGFLMITLPVSLYFIALESSHWQATWGKQKKSLIVTHTDGSRLTILRAMSRTLLKFIPWELSHTCIWQIRFAQQEPSQWIVAGFVLVWIMVGINLIFLSLSPAHQTLYDWIANTSVMVKK